MKICIPVAEYQGLESPVYGHFGSAPCFALVDTETMTVSPLANRDQKHIHGACSPVKAMAGAKPDAVIVGGIGAGALLGLRAAGIKVYRAGGGTVADAVRQFKAAELPEIEDDGACASHAGGHGCNLNNFTEQDNK
jgi:predicted Fe-Mo cluster-binding NifX family protein